MRVGIGGRIGNGIGAGGEGCGKKDEFGRREESGVSRGNVGTGKEGVCGSRRRWRAGMRKGKESETPRGGLGRRGRGRAPN